MVAVAVAIMARSFRWFLSVVAKLVFIGALDLNMTFLCTFLPLVGEKYKKNKYQTAQ
jgi:hypothetical protein